MKVIVRGKLPEEKVYRATCRHCRTTIEFQRKEAKYNSDLRDGDFLSIACPTCTRPIITSV
jgi:hypothetical protein